MTWFTSAALTLPPALKLRRTAEARSAKAGPVRRSLVIGLFVGALVLPRGVMAQDVPSSSSSQRRSSARPTFAPLGQLSRSQAVS